MNKNKVVLITGSGSGFGYLTALRFAKEGWTTYATVRSINTSGSGELVSKTKEFPNLRVIQMDVTKQDEIDNAVEHIIRESNHIDVLVNNAGYGYVSPVETFSIEEMKEQHDVNIYGFVRMIKAVAPHMRKEKSGLIINISSINGLVPFPLYGVYSSSKFAMETLSEAFDFELRPFGIKTFLVEPGSFTTDFSTNVHKSAGAENSVYKDLMNFIDNFHKSQGNIPKNLKWLFSPERVANKIYEIGSTPGYRSFRNVIGVDARMFLFFNRVLPRFVVQFIMRKIYNW